MCPWIVFEDLKTPDDVARGYSGAADRIGPTVLVEYAELYYEG